MATDYNEYNSAYQLVFHDTLSNGLTFNASSVKVYVNGNSKPVNTDNYTITNPATDGHSFDVTIHDVRSLGDDISKVRVEYTAKLNDKAVIGSEGNPNKMYMEFSNNPNNEQGGDKGQTPEDKVIVFTYKVVINKIDSRRGYNTMDPITFNVIASHDTESADPKLTDLNGNLVDGQIIFTADKEEGTLTADVVNYKGSELPNTGGMGTTILYAAGVILILAAGAFLVMQKKAENK